MLICGLLVCLTSCNELKSKEVVEVTCYSGGTQVYKGIGYVDDYIWFGTRQTNIVLEESVGYNGQTVKVMLPASMCMVKAIRKG